MVEKTDQKETARAVALVGPTASGKTGVALHLAESLGTEIINVDSRQVYRRMDIGTAKPSLEQRNRIRHHMLDLVDPGDTFNVGDFRRLVEELAHRLQQENKIPFFAGGTGLYIKVILDGLCAAPQASPHLRRWLNRAAGFPAGGLHTLLERVDPEAAGRIHPNDSQRLTRALEVYYLTGETLSDRQRRHRFAGGSFQATIVGLRREAGDLKERISRRLDEMIAAGFVDEVRGLLESGYAPSLPAMRAVGYPQVAAFLEGKKSLEEAVEETRRATWQYARRQMTWFRGVQAISWIDAAAGEDDAALAARVGDLLRARFEAAVGT